MFTLAHSVAGELDDGDDQNQAKHDTEDRSNRSGLVPGLASSEVSTLLSSLVGRHRWGQPSVTRLVASG